jgi:hypothetical protein
LTYGKILPLKKWNRFNWLLMIFLLIVFSFRESLWFITSKHSSEGHLCKFPVCHEWRIRMERNVSFYRQCQSE